ncbi:hypothetical protein HQ865_18965 [Mucilaginibacter mali]|uniref:Uncharacterized protein n=1 Tax=Mucilaginibacter mali TaxID=2740462 RepID=A0A7D4UEI4_9SPHI|nr:hypothetical protein [Mucilaginibacter mali]QKJ31759.1 hypothetical protein HQ865_18965 [Mucilaginibacter mali]
MKKFNTHMLTLLLCIPVFVFAQKRLPADEALKLFKPTIPAIEKQTKGIVQEPNVFIGDINGDKKPDCIVSYVVTPKEGGNAIMQHTSVIYLNTGNGMRNAGSFPDLKFCYGISAIKDGLIMIDKIKCAPPYMEVTGRGKLAYRDGKIVEVKK